MLMMVLNDGETFTNLSGCKIVEAPDGTEMVKGKGYPVICEFWDDPHNDSIHFYWKHTPQNAQGFVEFGYVLP